MDKKEIAAQVQAILTDYDPAAPDRAAAQLRDYWLTFEPKSTAGIKAEQREKQETVGIPVPVLQAIGKEIAKQAKKDVDHYLALTQTLWHSYGREGRVVTVYPLGAMELAAPERLLPEIKKLCWTCLTWEDADQLSMRALEPIIRKDPENWLEVLEPWLIDENLWVRRAGVTAVGRLPMKHPAYTKRCLKMTSVLLHDGEQDVRRAVSFAIRLSTRGEIAETRNFLETHVPPADPSATWVLCDVIRSMTKKFLPVFESLLPKYARWAADPGLSRKERRSVESAVRTLKKGLQQ